MRKRIPAVFLFSVFPALAFAGNVGCNQSCLIKSEKIGRNAANKFAAKSVAKGGKLGPYIRAEAGLSACGHKGKSSAIDKKRKKLLNSMVRSYIDSGHTNFNGKGVDSDVAFTSFLTSVQSFYYGYHVGYLESTRFNMAISGKKKQLMCDTFNKLADMLLFSEH